MKIAFLGLGKMGKPMARRLIAAGYEVTVWNRTTDRAHALEDAQVASSPAEAVHSAEAVLTMLFDDAANEQVLFGLDGAVQAGAIQAMQPGALHILHSTISVDLCDRLTAEHALHGQLFVAAPVFGRPNIAEDGRLWIAAAGADDAIAKARPLLEPLSRGISVIGREPRQAQALKLGGNFLISAMIHALSESFVYAQGQDIDPAAFLDTVNSALFQSPFYAAYGNVMLHPPEQPGATITLGAKDLQLLREAAASRHTSLSLADNLAEVFAEVMRAGLGNEDWAAGLYSTAQQRGILKA
jgi:3-hydroxyisobutyrate dehydrogenase-like beta-hydroxyacid dehydrogenase